ncbi:MAG: 2-oxo acid dehydrogenase subunit E2, partial [Oceanococcaceae bacterium]
ITREDVQSYAKRRLQQPESAGGGALPAIPAVDFAKFGPVETVPLPRIRKLSAAHLHRSWVNVPHVTQTDRADITDLEAFRKARNAAGDGPKLTLLPFIMKACAHVLRRYPDFRSALAPDGESLIRRESVHIGFAADTEHGLVVPVVRDVDQKSVSALAEICAELADKARRGKLSPGDMQGGCFSISSLGGIGGEHFTPIVNAPEVAILGVSRASMAPVWDGQSFIPRLIVPLSLSYDHRVIDGAAAARFTTELAGLLADMRLMLL